MLTWIICIVLFCIIFYIYCIKPMTYWKKRGVKQIDPKWLFGDNFRGLMGKENLAESIVRFYNKHPNERYVGMYQLTRPVLVLRDPELIKQMTVKDFEHFLDHQTFIPEKSNPLWSKNLFALKGQEWREMRPILSPSFTSSKMKGIFVLMSEVTERFVDYLKQRGDKETIEVEMKDTLTRFGNDIIASTAFGLEVDSMKEKNNHFYLMGKEATTFGGLMTLKILGYSLAPKIYDFLKVNLFSKEVIQFFYNLVDDTIKLREEKNIVRPDMIHLLLEARKGTQKVDDTNNIETGFATVEEFSIGKVSGNNKKQITNLDIAAQAMIFFFAGFDSVTNVMAFMAYELAIHPEIQKRLREEVEETSIQCGGKLTYEALMKMKYMDMVISESLRKWPNFMSLDRVCTKPYTIQPVLPNEKPIRLNIGDMLWLPVFGLHHDPKYYPDPEKFDPERFNEENKQKINPYAYLPFGSGPRNCIGSRFALMEIKILFYYLLLNFELVPIKKTQIPIKLEKNNFSMKAEKGIHLGLKPVRNKN